MDLYKILIAAIIVICVTIVVMIILKPKQTPTAEGFVQPRGFAGRDLRTNMLSNAYAGGDKYAAAPESLRSIVSDSVMPNAGSIDTASSYYVSNNQLIGNKPNEVAESTSGNVMVQNNQVLQNADNAEGFKSKETFLNSYEGVTVNKMGNLEGPAIYTNGRLDHGVTWDQVMKDAKEGKQITDHSITGAGRGNGFEDIYEGYAKIQDKHDQSPTGVRSQEEIDEITKSLNYNNDNHHNNLLTRAGAGKARIKLDPTGTVGVMEGNAKHVPERERNQTIYSTGHVIPIQGYDLDYADQYLNMTNSGSGFGKAMAANVDTVISGIGENAAANAKILSTGVEGM